MPESNSDDLVNCSSPGKQIAQSIHPPPAFGSSTNLEALALEASGQSENASINSHTNFSSEMPCLLMRITTDLWLVIRTV
nr:ACT domain-containing protein [Tanacetum cinerariifolium]